MINDTPVEVDKELAIIIQNHNKQIADTKRGYPAGTQDYFTVNQILETIFNRLAAGAINQITERDLDGWPTKTVKVIPLSIIKKMLGVENE